MMDKKLRMLPEIHHGCSVASNRTTSIEMIFGEAGNIESLTPRFQVEKWTDFLRFGNRQLLSSFWWF